MTNDKNEKSEFASKWAEADAMRTEVLRLELEQKRFLISIREQDERVRNEINGLNIKNLSRVEERDIAYLEHLREWQKQTERQSTALERIAEALQKSLAARESNKAAE